MNMEQIIAEKTLSEAVSQFEAVRSGTISLFRIKGFSLQEATEKVDNAIKKLHKGYEPLLEKLEKETDRICEDIKGLPDKEKGEIGLNMLLEVVNREDLKMKKTIKTAINKSTKNNPITRAELCEMTGLSDRIVRRIIADLREEGNWIINRGNGYYRGRSESDRKYLIADYNSRITKMAKTVRALESHVRGQINVL